METQEKYCDTSQRDIYLPKFLFDYQKDGVRTIIDAVQRGDRGYLLSWDMGLGKTVSSMTIYFKLPEIFNRLLILAPKNTLKQWKNEIEEFYPGHEAAIVDTTNYEKVSHSARILITNYEAMVRIAAKDSTYFEFTPNTFVILDEASKVKNRSTRAYEYLLNQRGPAFLLALSGTPLENNLREFWNIIYLIDTRIIPENEFFTTFCEYGYVMLRGGKRQRVVTGYRNHELFHERIKDHFLRKLKADVAPNMKKKNIDTMTVPRTVQQVALEALIKKYCMEYMKEQAALNIIAAHLDDAAANPVLHSSNIETLPDISMSSLSFAPCDFSNAKTAFLNAGCPKLISSRFFNLWTGECSHELYGRLIDLFDQMQQSYDTNPVRTTRLIVLLARRPKANVTPLALRFIEQAFSLPEGGKPKSLTSVAFFSLGFLRELEDDPRLLMYSDSKILQDRPVIGLTLEDKGAKVLAIVPLIQEHVLNGKKAVIFTQYANMLPLLERELAENGISSVSASGAYSSKQREEALRLFRSERSVFIVTDAFAYGGNLQFADFLVNFDIPWNPARLKQRIDRIHRIGIINEKSIVNLISDGVDKAVYDSVNEKDELSMVAVDGKSFQSLRSSLIKSVFGEEYAKITKQHLS